MSFIKKRSAAFAPATIGNVCVGFDILGMAIEGCGDRVELRLRSDSKMVIQDIRGTQEDLPRSPELNTAGAALLALQRGQRLKLGFDVFIEKGIPIGSGMGGSAASAVAAVVAAQSMLQKKMNFDQQFLYALEGEKMASGAAHPDNIAPCLRGGLTLASLNFKVPVVSLPFPSGISWVLVHPDIKVETKKARQILSSKVKVEQWVQQSANLCSFLSGLYKKDLTLIRQGFSDVVIEPQRAHLIPGFNEIKDQVLAQKSVLGFSISGSGPSVFAWTESKKSALRVGQLIQKEFERRHISSECYSGQGPAPKAHSISLNRRSTL